MAGLKDAEHAYELMFDSAFKNYDNAITLGLRRDDRGGYYVELGVRSIEGHHIYFDKSRSGITARGYEVKPGIFVPIRVRETSPVYPLYRPPMPHTVRTLTSALQKNKPLAIAATTFIAARMLCTSSTNKAGILNSL